MADKTRFLDYGGLKRFWSLINAKFVAGGNVTVTNTGAEFTLTTGDGTTVNMGSIGIASKTGGAGLMSAAQAATVDNFSAGVEALVPFTGLQIDGENVTITDDKAGNRLSNIGLSLKNETVDDVTKTYIVLGDNAAESKAISKIDVSNFIVNGLLANEELVTGTGDNAGKTFIKFTWNLADGTTKDEYIDVTTLIDYYYADNKGIALDTNTKTFSIKLDGNTLEVTDNGLKVKASTLEPYAKTAEVNAKLEGYYTKSEIDSTLANYDTSDEVNAKVKVATDAVSTLEGKVYTKDDTDNAITNALKNYDTSETVNTKLTGYYTKTEIDDIKGSIDNTIGTVTSGSTVVQMISAAESAAKQYTDDTFDLFVPITDKEIEDIVNGTADSGEATA